jgi:hypothetical protein
MKRSEVYAQIADKYRDRHEDVVYPNGQCRGGCIVLGNLFPKGYASTPDEIIKKTYPEFFKFNPSAYNCVWWEPYDFESREQAFRRASELAKDSGN